MSQENVKLLLEFIHQRLDKEDQVIAAFIYGSSLTPYFNDESDIDIAVLTPPTNRIDPLAIDEIRQDLEVLTKRDIHLSQIQPELSMILRNEIATKGTLLFTKDPQASLMFQIKTPQMYEDFMFMRKKLEDHYIKESLK